MHHVKGNAPVGIGPRALVKIVFSAIACSWESPVASK